MNRHDADSSIDHHTAATRDDAQYQFDLSRYHQAVQIQAELLREANEAQERLEEADAALREIEAKLGDSFEMAKAEVRIRAKEAAGVDLRGHRGTRGEVH